MPKINARVLKVFSWLNNPFVGGMCYGLFMRGLFQFAPTKQFLGDVMATSFALGVPFAVGAITVFLRPLKDRSWGKAVSGALLSVTLFVLGTGFLLWEGLICMVMALPLFLLIGVLGALAATAVSRKHDNKRINVSVIALLPLISSMFEAQQHHAFIPASQIRHEIVREAVLDQPSEVIWAKLLNTPDIPERQYAGSIANVIGMPPPKSGVLRHAHGAYLRRSFWGKNIYFDEPIIAMETNRHLSWGYRFYPDSFPPGAMDEHVVIGGKYFDLIDTDFTLTPLSDTRTKVQIRIGFRVSTDFNFYAVPAANLVLGNFAETALTYFGSNASMQSLK